MKSGLDVYLAFFNEAKPGSASSADILRAFCFRVYRNRVCNVKAEKIDST
jgi:hypothetical protein